MDAIVWLIIVCEISFWVIILAGLVTRYIFKNKKLGLILLAFTPLVDLILLIAASIDLYRGAVATTAHALAAVYIGVSVAFGKKMIQWADERFQYYFLKSGAKPVRLTGIEHGIHYLKGWLRHLFAYVIGSGLLMIVILLIKDSSRTEALNGVLKIWSLVLGIDLLIGISYIIWPKKAKADAS
ncbi:hypothetical protein J9303_08950 [Bacillaceae bacterium Marseille-Q3522]|nr:hypothetical protein [Bacillaceae bacterium Marseille-Q3522]